MHNFICDRIDTVGMEVVKELKNDRMQASKVGHLRFCVCVCVCGARVCALACVCGCSVRTPACFSTFWLSGALRSQAGEWRGHIRGSFRAPTHPPRLHDPSPSTSHHPNPPHTFPSSPVIPRHPSSTSSSYSSSPRGDGVSRPLGGGGGAERQGASVADSRQVRFFVDTAEEEGHMRTCTQTHQGV